ncbi:MAG: glycosyltransferase [Pirellulaceae bacterium]|jgi:processive 1,2-diacylglycerol beta-glucosyltransferase|nr:glycosyltransferase [Pirellulaceae bacterium]
MSKCILVLSASVGAGHLRAAQAVELAIRQLDPTAMVENMDVLALTNAAFRRLYGKAYLDLVNRAPHVLGYFYDLMDRPVSPRRKTDRLRYLVKRLNLAAFVKYLEQQVWDVVVNTHFLPAEILAHLRSQERFRAPHFTVTTDFETHRLWVNQPCDLYFTATQESAKNLEHWGVPPESLVVSGIPVHPAFSRLKPRQQCLQNQQLQGERPVILQLSGGFGVGPVEQLLKQLLEVTTPAEVVVVAGRNEELRRRLELVQPPPRHRLIVVGYTEHMDELMTAADVVVSKPGGLTTSEALACGAAMAVVNPIPGQESRNSDFLLENGAALKINNLATLPFKLDQVLSDPKRLAQLKRNAKRLGRPQAAFEVARHALDWG